MIVPQTIKETIMEFVCDWRGIPPPPEIFTKGRPIYMSGPTPAQGISDMQFFSSKSFYTSYHPTTLEVKSMTKDFDVNILTSEQLSALSSFTRYVSQFCFIPHRIKNNHTENHPNLRQWEIKIEFPLDHESIDDLKLSVIQSAFGMAKSIDADGLSKMFNSANPHLETTVERIENDNEKPTDKNYTIFTPKKYFELFSKPKDYPVYKISQKSYIDRNDTKVVLFDHKDRTLIFNNEKYAEFRQNPLTVDFEYSDKPGYGVCLYRKHFSTEILDCMEGLIIEFV